jgi:predicted transport protein
MSSQALDKATQTQIANIEKSTGKTLQQWMDIVNSTTLSKHGDLVNFLKTSHGFTHGNANVIVHFARQSHAGATDDTNSLVTEQYKGKEKLIPLYNQIINGIQQLGNDVELAPKKTYVSLRRKKQFALIQPSTKDRIDIGLSLKNVQPAGIATAAGSWNSMCTHRIKIEAETDINPGLFSWIQQAYEQAG